VRPLGFVRHSPDAPRMPGRTFKLFCIKILFGADLQPSSNFFPKFCLASAPPPPANFCKICVPKQKNFLYIFLMSRAQIFFKKEKKIFCFGFLRKAKRRKRSILDLFPLFIFLVAIVPPNPTLVTAWNSRYLRKMKSSIFCVVLTGNESFSGRAFQYFWSCG